MELGHVRDDNPTSPFTVWCGYQCGGARPQRARRVDIAPVREHVLHEDYVTRLVGARQMGPGKKTLRSRAVWGGLRFAFWGSGAAYPSLGC